jgi:carboxyl-terminal processing protease
MMMLVHRFRRHLFIGAVFCAAACHGVCVGSAQPQTSALDATDRAVVASKIYSLVQQYFAHWEGVGRPEVEAAYRDYIDQVVRDQTRREFDLATLKFIARLRNGHTQFFDTALDGRPLKFRLLQVENQWVVLNSQDRRLSRGAVVQSLNGGSVDDFVSQASQYVAASNDRLASTHVFSYPGLFPGQVSLVLQSGAVVMIDRSVPADTAEPASVQASQGRWLREGRLAYIRVPSFGDAAYERTAVELVRQFASAPNLIVDVRGNGGGTTPRQLIGALMNQPWRTWQETTPQQIALFDAQGLAPIQAARPSRVQPPSPDAYQGRLFLLVDRFCGSACEDFVMPFKDTSRAVVVGETTQGSSGNPYRVDLGSGMRVAVGAVRYRFPDGAPFEGVGIAPNVMIERRISDLVASRDAVLERARELADVPR